MDDTWLVAISLSVSAFGIAGLLFALILMEPPKESIMGAKAAEDGTAITVSGTVQKTVTRGNRTIITISQPSTIDIITDNPVSIDKGACVDVSGKKTTFAGTPQLQASRIKLCKK